MPPADLGVNAHVLRFDGRGEGVGRWSVVIDVSTENLSQGDEITADEAGGRTAEQISFAVMWQPIHRCLQRLTRTQQIAVIQGQ